MDSVEQLTAVIVGRGDNASAADYIARGKAYWARGQRREAINDYLVADRLSPGGEAAELLEITRSILDYRNTDLLNP